MLKMLLEIEDGNVDHDVADDAANDADDADDDVAGDATDYDYDAMSAVQ